MVLLLLRRLRTRGNTSHWEDRELKCASGAGEGASPRSSCLPVGLLVGATRGVTNWMPFASGEQQPEPPEPSGFVRRRARRVRPLREMCFESPEVVEVLARPDEDEPGLHRRLVAAGGSLAHADDQ